MGKRRVRYNRYKEYLKCNPQLYKPVADIKFDNDDVKARVCNYVLGPSLCAFILWTLNEAIKSGKKRLYFLARDGYLMYKSAKIFCEKLNLPIECRYLSCSRYSIWIPMYHLNKEDALEYICRGGIDINMTKILSRAGLTKEEQAVVLDDLKFNIGKYEAIPYAKLNEVRSSLRECEFFMQYMCCHSKKAMVNIVGYLEQEGFTDGVDRAIVDSGWAGSMQKSLNLLLTYMGSTDHLEGYYWGLYELPGNVERNDYHCFYFSPERAVLNKVYFSNCLFEAIYSAPHGMTVGYEKSNEQFFPVYCKISKERKEFIKCSEYWLVQYTKSLTMNIDSLINIDYGANKETVQKLLKLFMGKPMRAEVDIYGNLIFSDDVLEGEMQPVAAVMNSEEISDNHVLNKVLVMAGIKKGIIKESAWYEGSVVRAGQHVGYHLWQNVMYKYLLYLWKTYLWRSRNAKV